MFQYFSQRHWNALDGLFQEMLMRLTTYTIAYRESNRAKSGCRNCLEKSILGCRSISNPHKFPHFLWEADGIKRLTNQSAFLSKALLKSECQNMVGGNVMFINFPQILPFHVSKWKHIMSALWYPKRYQKALSGFSIKFFPKTTWEFGLASSGPDWNGYPLG